MAISFAQDGAQDSKSPNKVAKADTAKNSKMFEQKVSVLMLSHVCVHDVNIAT